VLVPAADTPLGLPPDRTQSFMISNHESAGALASSPWRRLHLALMPDYSRKAAAYWWVVVCLGAAAVVGSALSLADRPTSVNVQVVVGVAVAMLAGFFPVRVPHSKNSYAAGEIFIFLLLMIHGPAAAALAASGEAAVGAFRTSHRWTSRIISPAIAALAMLGTGSLLQAILGALEAQGLDSAGVVIVAAAVFAMANFIALTLMITAVPRLKRNEPLQLSDLFGVFGWVGIAYAGSATVAALLYLVYQQTGISVLMGLLPLLAMLLTTLHYFFRQQEAAEAVRRTGAEAAEREAANAARHIHELEASERRFHSAFTHASIGMALLAFDGRVLQANPALAGLLGLERDELVQRPVQDFLIDEHRAKLAEQFSAIAREVAEGFALELRCRHRAGGEVWVAAHCSFFSEPASSSPCLILQVQDITARRKAEEGLHRLAFHDSLTGLPNRRRFHELLAQAVQRAQREAGWAFAVMFLDFDRFKLINDSLGHDAGDAFLVQVSRRIQDSLRPDDVVARLGGDEFAVLVQHLTVESQAVTLAERMMETLRRPVQVAGTELNTSASIGITFSRFGYTKAEHVLRDADIAMYKAKGAGKARYALFDGSLHKEVARRLRLEGELRHAIDNGQLSVAYQPIQELGTGRLAGFEALVRWKHPVDGALAPGAFLPIAEEAGMMVRISDFVLNCACRQLRRWQDELDERPRESARHSTAGPDAAPRAGPAPPLTVSVNISSHDIAHPAFVARVSRALVESGLQAQQLTLELTENILMSHLEGALGALIELQQLGVGLAVDDFGTGYSSLSHLAKLPIDTLKIDRSFVARLKEGSAEAAVVRSIILLGGSLGKSVLAEGIETMSQFGQLHAMGCRLGQGFLLGHPLTPEQAETMLAGAGPRQGPIPVLEVAPVERAANIMLH
jgi:diguanylate cyclase (GGDEF)-like protein/PAS domain S-box-containing protein